MPDFLKRFDGSGRTPRATQVDGLNWISENWTSSRLASLDPVGSGKSAKLRAIQIVTGGHIITPSNVLIDQYTDEYTQVNALKGKTHYLCANSGLSCHEWQDLAEQKPCPDCPYSCAKKRASTEPTFFNPMSLFYFGQTAAQKHNILMVDEAHQLPSMALMLAGGRFRRSQYRFNSDVVNERHLVTFLDDLEQRLRVLTQLYKQDAKKLKEVLRERANVRQTRLGLMENPQNYAIWLEKGLHRGRPDVFLNVKPLRPPKRLMEQIVGAKKLIVVSGTLFEHDLEDLFGGEAYKLYDSPSPIPVESRLVHFQPSPFKMNAQTDPKKAAQLLQDTVKREGTPNTIIHVSYSWAAKLRPHLEHLGWYFNTPESKSEVLEEFKQRGGVWVASGCAEGIDLKGDLCRLNVIPWMLFPNIGDPVVAKRKTLADGEKWYMLETVKALIQQAGRSTRAPDDYSKTLILDNNFRWVYPRVKNFLPKSFVESVRGA